MRRMIFAFACLVLVQGGVRAEDKLIEKADMDVYRQLLGFRISNSYAELRERIVKIVAESTMASDRVCMHALQPLPCLVSFRYLRSAALYLTEDMGRLKGLMANAGLSGLPSQFDELHASINVRQKALAADFDYLKEKHGTIPFFLGP